MKRFIIRYLFSFLLTAILFSIDLFLNEPNHFGYIGIILIWFYFPVTIVSTILFYFLLAFISKRKQLIIFMAFFVTFSFIELFKIEKLILLNAYFIIVCLAQLAIPNFHSLRIKQILKS